ncbi:MAG TPA: PDZ domain-containing protein, partial [Aeromicrobium sp.]|nr:PDZ domain-containing protein [Aeromicrobium sp.]
DSARIGLTVGNARGGDGITAVGAEVKKVTDGSAGAKAGLKVGDIVTGLNGHAIGSADALVSSIRGFSPGDKVDITFRRGDKTETTEAILDSDGGELSP